MLAARGLWSVSPLTAKFGEFRGRQLIEKNEALLFRPILQLLFKKEGALAAGILAEMT